jgi:ATP-dependent DNA ligase
MRKRKGFRVRRVLQMLDAAGAADASGRAATLECLCSRTEGAERAKRLDSLYEPGKRSDAWIKVKFSKRQELVVGGYKPAGNGFDSVLVGF